MLLSLRATTIGVDAGATAEFPGQLESVATGQRVRAIAFPKSNRLDAPGAGDAYGDVGAVRDGRDRTITTPRSGRPQPTRSDEWIGDRAVV